MQGGHPIWHRVVRGALIGLLVAVISLAIWAWPELLVPIAVGIVSLAVIVYAAIRSARVRRGLLWALMLAACGCALGLTLFGLTPYGLVLLMIGLGQLVAALYFWPRRTFRKPTITREMMEPLPRFRHVT